MQKVEDHNPLAFFIEKCKNHGLKITPQRTAIYKALLGSKEHPTTDTVFRNIQPEYPNISFDTVNRTLLTFAQVGIIEVIESFSGARRFDPNIDSHHHIHCVQCGDILDFEDADYDNLRVPDYISNKHRIISKRVILNVLCESCAA